MRKSAVIVFISILLACVASVTILRLGPTFFSSSRHKMQVDLAKELGVNLGDYPYRTSFPVGYFYTILQPGMTVDDVHKIVQGYEKVLHCGNISEIYYYFSTKLEDAKRFQIIYDEQGELVRLEGEEDDSRTLQTSGCESGLLNR